MRLPVAVGMVVAALGCAGSPGPNVSADPRLVGPDPSVWSLDLVRTRPGQQAEYLRGVRANWAGARRLALEEGEIRSFRALAAPPDSGRGWDVLLVTQYRDSSAYARREATFQRLFADARYLAGRVTTALPSDQLRSFFSSDVVLKEVAGSAP